MATLPKVKAENELIVKPDPEETKIHNDLAVSKSEEEYPPVPQSSHHIINEEEGCGDLWF